jgi:hypothetical protein
MDKLPMFCTLALLLVVSAGANYRTPNFVVEAETPELARQVGAAAESWRMRLARDWLGKELPRWPRPCHVSVRVAQAGAPGGHTRLVSQGGGSAVQEISLEGPVVRILDSVLPHEMTHAVFATYFHRPLPRWADEGASTIVEHEVQRAQQERHVTEMLLSGSALSVAELFLADGEHEQAWAMYAQGYSLTRFLLAHGGKQKFIGFLTEGVSGNSWSEAVRRHYGFQNFQDLQGQWLAWAMPGL